MNEQMQRYARNTTKEGLSRCTSAEQLIFKRMHSPDALDLPINEVVDKIEPEKLDWAMQQILNTLEEKRKEQPHDKSQI